MSDQVASPLSVTPPDPPPPKYWLFVLRLLPPLAGALWLGYFALDWKFFFAPAFGLTIGALLWLGSRWL